METIIFKINGWYDDRMDEISHVGPKSNKCRKTLCVYVCVCAFRLLTGSSVNEDAGDYPINSTTHCNTAFCTQAFCKSLSGSNWLSWLSSRLLFLSAGAGKQTPKIIENVWLTEWTFRIAKVAERGHFSHRTLRRYASFVCYFLFDIRHVD